MFVRSPQQRGITMLETLIVIAIIGLLSTVGYGAYRSFTKANLRNDSARLAGFLRRASEVASETGALARVTFDLDKGSAMVELCEGASQVRRNPDVGKALDAESTKRELDDARERLKADPQRQKFQSASPEDEAKLAGALAGHHVGDQPCTPALDTYSGDSDGRPLQMQLSEDVKVRQVWVQHLDESATHGQVAIHFFPMGWAEKAIVELSAGETVFTIHVHGLSGQVDLDDGEAQDVDDFMMRDPSGEKEKPR